MATPQPNQTKGSRQRRGGVVQQPASRSRPTAAFDVSQAVRISAIGVMQDLGALPPFPSSFATATNSNGDIIAGYITYPESFLQGRSWRWTQATGMQLLPNPVGGIDATAVDMTPDGSVIAGYAYTFTTKAMVWRNGMAEFLGTVPGTPFGTSYAFAVSDDGQVVVGRSDVPGSNGAQAVRWVGNEPLQLVPASMALRRWRARSTVMGHSSADRCRCSFNHRRATKPFCGRLRPERFSQRITSLSGAF